MALAKIGSGTQIANEMKSANDEPYSRMQLQIAFRHPLLLFVHHWIENRGREIVKSFPSRYSSISSHDWSIRMRNQTKPHSLLIVAA